MLTAASVGTLSVVRNKKKLRCNATDGAHHGGRWSLGNHVRRMQRTDSCPNDLIVRLNAEADIGERTSVPN